MSPFAQTILIGLLIALVITGAAAIAAQRIAAKPKWRLAIAVVAGPIATFVAGWYGGRAAGFFGGDTPECPGVVDPMQDAAQLALAVTCGNTVLTFEEMSHAAYDVQFLDIEVNGRAAPGGPLAAIYPEVNAHRNKQSELDAGRIVAKVWVDPAATAGYPKLGLGPGINYIWIDANNPPPAPVRTADLTRFPNDAVAGMRMLADSARGVRVNPERRLRAVTIPTAPGFTATVLPVTYYDHSRAALSTLRNQPLARWIFRPDDVGEWMDCDKYGCCDVGN